MGAQEWAGAVLTVTALTGSYLAGMRIWWAWYINIAAVTVWIGYMIYSEQWKYAPVIACYLFVYGSNAYRWTRCHRRDGGKRVPIRTDPLEEP